jgi:hypothetical protein
MCSELKCSWVKWSEDLSNRLSNIIRRYVDHMKFAALWLLRLSHSFIFFWLHSLSFYMYSYYYVFLFLCIFYYYVTCSLVSLSILIVMYVPLCVFCVLFVCKCVLYCCYRVSTQLQLKINNYKHYIVSVGMQTSGYILAGFARFFSSSFLQSAILRSYKFIRRPVTEAIADRFFIILSDALCGVKLGCQN